MKSKKTNYIVVFMMIIVLLLPFFLDSLIKKNVVRFDPGTVDSWINFWGSYVGAIIGASVVYFVAIVQIKKQDEQQMTEMELRGKYEIKREMKLFYMTTKMEKIEELIENVDELLTIIPRLFTHMYRISIKQSENGVVQDLELIERLKREGEQCIREIDQKTAEVDRLIYYIAELDEERHRIITLMRKVTKQWKEIAMIGENHLKRQNHTENFMLVGASKEAYEELLKISGTLDATLANVQHLFTEEVK